MKEGKSTKEILLKVPGQDRQVRSFVTYERGKIKKSKEDPLAAMEYIDDLEKELKEKDKMIAEFETQASNKEVSVETEIGAPVEINPLAKELMIAQAKIRTLKGVNKTLLELI